MFFDSSCTDLLPWIDSLLPITCNRLPLLSVSLPLERRSTTLVDLLAVLLCRLRYLLVKACLLLLPNHKLQQVEKDASQAAELLLPYSTPKGSIRMLYLSFSLDRLFDPSSFFFSFYLV
jgi:hypothetical protein